MTLRSTAPKATSIEWRKKLRVETLVVATKLVMGNWWDVVSREVLFETGNLQGRGDVTGELFRELESDVGITCP